MHHYTWAHHGSCTSESGKWEIIISSNFLVICTQQAWIWKKARCLRNRRTLRALL